AAGTTATINDTAPTNDRWNLATIEIAPSSGVLPPGPPAAPTNLKVDSVASNQVSISWTPNPEDHGGSAWSYDGYGDGVRIASRPSPGSGWTDTTVQPGTTYKYAVSTQHISRGEGPKSDEITVTTPVDADTIPPSAAISSPAAGATVSGSV